MSFICLLAECGELAPDIDAKRVNEINLRDAQKKFLDIFLENRSLATAVTP